MVRELTWGTQDTVLLDDTPPRVRAVRLSEGHLEIELTEEPDLATAQAAIDVGQPATWALSADGLTLRTEAPLLAGGFALTIQPSLADQAGLLLQQLFELSLQIPAIEPNAVFFEEPDPQETQSSSVGNLYGFHGLPRDPETGLIYARNRYYDPELGRFITADPLGYADGPSMYGFAGYSSVNFGDPMGLAFGDGSGPIGPQLREIRAQLAQVTEQKRLRELREDKETLRGAFGLIQQVGGEVSINDLQVALVNYFRGRPRVSYQAALFYTFFLTGQGQGINGVLGELEGMAGFADFVEHYPLAVLAFVGDVELVYGIVHLARLVGRIGLREVFAQTLPGLGLKVSQSGVRQFEFRTREEVVEYLVGHTQQGNRVGKAIKLNRINVNVLGDNLFDNAYFLKGGEGEAPIAFAFGEGIYLRRSRGWSMLTDVVHEGTHALDYINSVPHVGYMWEKRAYFFERQFQRARGDLLLEHETIDEMLEHIYEHYEPQ